MPSVTRECRVCGKQFKVCRTPNMGGALRWQDIACCKEHAAQYFEEIARSRGEIPETKAPEPAPAPEAQEKAGEPEKPEPEPEPEKPAEQPEAEEPKVEQQKETQGFMRFGKHRRK